MRGRFERILGLAILLPLMAAPDLLRAESRALVVAGLSGGGSDQELLQSLAQKTKQGLVQRGFADANVVVLGISEKEKANRAAVLAALGAARSLKPGDEFWLVLLGHGGRDAEGGPLFQLSGPRLAAADLKGALDAIPARQFVFVGSEESGGYASLLLQPNRTVLTATRGEGEVNQPRFPEAWVASLLEGPGDPPAAIAARASEKVEQYYAQNQLARGEHARLGDAASGKILEAPFGVDGTAKSAQADARPGADGPTRLITASDIEIPIRDPNAEWETHSPTAENKNLIAAAAKAPNPEGYAAVMLEKRLAYSVDADRTTERVYFHRVYLAREEGVEAWSNYLLPQAPPATTTKLQVARVIEPDGSSIVFNPAKLPAASDCSSGLCGAQTVVYLPQVRAGCVVEIGYKTRELLDATLPEFSAEIPLQENAPVLKTTLVVRVPEKQPFQVRLNNLPGPPSNPEAQNGWKTTSWALGPLEPLSPLPFDPPRREFAVWLGLTSFRSWDDFALWYRRLAQGSDVIDETVRKKAKELAASAPDRAGRIKAAYSFVSALRYVAVEIGVQGFRPRTPATVLANRYGDCKDKANLLSALLTCMDIEAYPALVNRGSSTDVTFPSWQFNHAICFVPKPKRAEAGQADDLWLDATDGIAPFGIPAPGDVARSALVFYKDVAKFQTVTLPPGAASASGSVEEWDLRDNGTDGWTGTVKSTPSGLTDYERRAGLRGATPRQRRNVVASIFSEPFPGGDFSTFTWGNPDDLSTPMVLQAAVTLSAAPGHLPAAGAGHWLAAFAEADRERPMLLNDGQPLRFRQVIRYHFAQPREGTPPAPFSVQAGGEALSVTWTLRDAKTWEREAVLDLRQTRIAPADYRSIRRALKDWAVALQPL
ncbi:protein of unknown function [Verrucomicrobium sp. GAS474]|uniref:DUF3857 domain-containing transglutaminase family protein n=1 Tax=Verrucomicrobium sp. GAS474 TaxID=1882831 RepID=UPI00087BED8D|nr:DUF3857 domain-containing protein [Verrucomicrobium sp. GAS474]SDU12814.1 protein of unknown function [Verrucomicrobium sp. GAS474]